MIERKVGDKMIQFEMSIGRLKHIMFIRVGNLILTALTIGLVTLRNAGKKIYNLYLPKRF